jgi:azurin
MKNSSLRPISHHFFITRKYKYKKNNFFCFYGSKGLKLIFIDVLKGIVMKKTGVALLLTLLSSAAYAGDCTINAEATASMAFNLKEIVISKKCTEVTLNLKNSGTMAKNMMGHNLVITKASDMQGVLADGSAAGLEKNYVKANDARVVAYTKVLGGGESTSVKFNLSKVKFTDSYMFFCSFPGHSGVMKGNVKFN